ncbi:TBC1 domain family member 1-like isoform X2 [Haliotis rufescens]|uniref:TBC1 domain family member 1-like isoform X2 n=1 Tax=Haliotis rufescens TaxID=6454 RepID=UPI00201F32E8|nr:TBC1 domain family member 1-like isoform X2 [Haliotis rufescens]
MESVKADPEVKQAAGMAESGDASSKCFKVAYLGSSCMDRRHTQSVQPWVMAEIRRRKEGAREVTLEVLPHCLKATSCDDMGTDALFEHKLQELTRFAKLHQEPRCFAYLSRQQLNSDDFECHVFMAHEPDAVPEIFNSIREATKDLSKEVTHEKVVNLPSNMGEGTFDQSKTFFEVMFIGRTQVATRKVPTSFIDELVERFDARGDEQKLRAQEQEQRQRHASGTSVRSLPASLEDMVCVTENNLCRQQERLQLHYDSAESSTDELASGDTYGSSSENVHGSSNGLSNSCQGPDLKVGQSADSDGSKEHLNGEEEHEVFVSRSSNVLKNEAPRNEASRVMLLQIGRKDLTLISPDKKQPVLERKFKDISFVSQGSSKQDVFGIIAREPKLTSAPSRDQNKAELTHVFNCYILRCYSEAVVSEIMCALQTAFATAHKDSIASKTCSSSGPARSASHNQICIRCPLHQLEKLCQEINGLSPHAAYDLLVKRVQNLTECEIAAISNTLKVENPKGYDEMVEILMIELRKLCERKQKEHVHISEGAKQCKNDFNILDDKSVLVKLDTFKNKAKKSLANSFESLLRGRKRDDAREAFRHRSGTSDSESSWTRSMDSSTASTPDASPLPSPISKDAPHHFPSPPASPETPRRRSSTVGAIPDPAISASRRNMVQKRRRDVNHNSHSQSRQNTSISPMKNMFLLAGSPSPGFAESTSSSLSTTLPDEFTPYRKRSSWRQAIFNRVVTPVQIPESPSFSDEADIDFEPPRTLTPTKIRCLWKKAILETLLLIRMEKENQSLRGYFILYGSRSVVVFKARQDEMDQKRQKLDYQEVTPCLKDVTKVWEELLAAENRTSTKIAQDKLLGCVKKGVPRSLRGDIWKLLGEQQHLHNASCLLQLPRHHLAYCNLLKQLTTHQHAILIDLGRTFPSHPYFATQLGPGQLELFNILKAYSLMDQDVGYCQGLSFVAGILIMHLEECQAFEILKFLMFELGLRQQYRPNMMALQIKLYQLTRLLHDHHKDLYNHFETHEIAPTLYAAPWFLTLFASQFPLGFVARVFDMIFIQGTDALFKVALVLLGNHRELIMQCDSFENVVEFLKTTLPEMVHVQMERVVNQAFDLDITAQLRSYEVEYHVLREEMMYSPQRGESDLVIKLEGINRNLRQQNMELLEKLQQAHGQTHSLEITVHNHQVGEAKLKSHIRTLELERAALLNAVTKLRQHVSAEEYEKLDLTLPIFSPSLPISPVHGFINHRLPVSKSANQPLADEHSGKTSRHTDSTKQDQKPRHAGLTKHSSH